jgi:uncharacterized 2Fe-2S/4Fe-4S cluster protein (DUF4445 family)
LVVEGVGVATYRVNFLPEGREAEVDEGATLLDAARAAGVHVGAICGGEGLCGKCRVVVRDGDGAVDAAASEHLSADETAGGYVLACKAKVSGDVTVEVPPESRLRGYRGLGEDGARYVDFEADGDGAGDAASADLDPLVKQVSLELAEPTVDDATADRERLVGELAKAGAGDAAIGLEVTRELPRALREFDDSRSAWKWNWDGRVTATLGRRDSHDELLSVSRTGADTAAPGHLGVALDVGTTSVVAHLVELATGRTLAAAAKYNSQLEFGADVISRINRARSAGGAEALHGAIARDVDILVEDVTRRSGAAREDVGCIVAAGNTTMLHLLLGLEPDLLRLSPFVPVATSPAPVRAADAGLRIHPRGLLYAMPMVGSYVGGDITAGLLVSRMHEKDEIALFLDIGTNGEVVLGSSEFLVACAASAGPAFEGGSMRCGMRAAAGAVDSVRISGPDLALEATTIGDAPAVGICGTGFIDALAQMFLGGLVDRSGALHVERAPERFGDSDEDGRPEFVLVSAKDSGAKRDVTIDQSDVENLIRTKGAIYAAADSLVESVGLSFAEVQKVYIAGGFGSKLDVASCITIGLLPDVPPGKVEFIGNGSVRGAKRALTSRAVYDEAQALRDRITYQELMVEASYMERYTSACFLPHTDVSRFESVEAKLQENG